MCVKNSSTALYFFVNMVCGFKNSCVPSWLLLGSTWTPQFARKFQFNFFSVPKWKDNQSKAKQTREMSSNMTFWKKIPTFWFNFKNVFWYASIIAENFFLIFFFRKYFKCYIKMIIILKSNFKLNTEISFPKC